MTTQLEQQSNIKQWKAEDLNTQEDRQQYQKQRPGLRQDSLTLKPERNRHEDMTDWGGK